MTILLYPEGGDPVTDGVSPTLLLDYQDSVDTRVTVHQPLSGPPLVVRRTGLVRLPAGDLRMLCATQDLAVAISDLCDGSRFVEVISDEIPGAPFQITPTGTRVRARQSPFKSWIVTVPYQRMT